MSQTFISSIWKICIFCAFIINFRIIFLNEIQYSESPTFCSQIPNIPPNIKLVSRVVARICWWAGMKPSEAGQSEA